MVLSVADCLLIYFKGPSLKSITMDYYVPGGFLCRVRIMLTWFFCFRYIDAAALTQLFWYGDILTQLRKQTITRSA